MSDYSFRIRLNRSPNKTAGIGASFIEIPVPEDVPDLVLHTPGKDASLKDADYWILRGSGWPSKQAAIKAGERYKNVLMITLAHLRMGADFGDRSGQEGFITDVFKDKIEEETGQRVLNDVRGLMVFESEPPPRFAKVGPMSATGVIAGNKFTTVLSHLVQQPPAISGRESLSLELFFASFFQETADARFLLLMMAVEALIEEEDRPEEVVAHVEHLIDLTKNAEDLPEPERNSLLGSLGRLKTQSLGQARRSLISSRLGDSTYKGKSAVDFFEHCYNIRSKLVHGNDPLPAQQDVGSLAATLEGLVSDLLSGGKMDISY